MYRMSVYENILMEGMGMIKNTKNLLAFFFLVAITFVMGYTYLSLDWDSTVLHNEGYLQKLS